MLHLDGETERARHRQDRKTERVRRFYDRLAGRYDKGIGLPEKLLFGGGRQWVCAQVRGDVLEIGIGTGRNIPYYPPAARLTGIDLSPAMLALARRRAQELDRPVDLRVGDAQALPFPDAQFDTVVSTLALCTIPDDRQAVAEAKRVLRSGGQFLLLEHVRSPLLPVRLLQRLVAPLFRRFAADQILREPLNHLETEGFVVNRLERSKLGIVERLSARRPA